MILFCNKFNRSNNDEEAIDLGIVLFLIASVWTDDDLKGKQMFSFSTVQCNAMKNVRVWGKKEMENCNFWQLCGDAYVPVL